MSTLNALPIGEAATLADIQARIDALGVGEPASTPTVSGGVAFSGEMAVSRIVVTEPDAVQPDAPAGPRVMESEFGFLGDCAAAGAPGAFYLRYARAFRPFGAGSVILCWQPSKPAESSVQRILKKISMKWVKVK
jgi:hypothetical protein